MIPLLISLSVQTFLLKYDNMITRFKIFKNMYIFNNN